MHTSLYLINRLRNGNGYILLSLTLRDEDKAHRYRTTIVNGGNTLEKSSVQALFCFNV